MRDDGLKIAEFANRHCEEEENDRYVTMELVSVAFVLSLLINIVLIFQDIVGL